MAASPVASTAPAAWAAARARHRAVGPFGWLVGGAVAVAATAAAAVVAVLFAAVLVVVGVLALLLTLLALAAAKSRRGGARVPTVITARWTGYGWDA